MWGIASVLWGISFSIVEFTTLGGNISTVGDSFSTVEGIQYIEGINQFMRRDNWNSGG